MKKYLIKFIDEIFSPEFMEYMAEASGAGTTVENLNKVFAEIERYEDSKGLEFVQFFGNDCIVFKAREQKA